MISYTSFAFFILYFGITFILYTVFPPKAKWCVLLFGSYAFYFISSKGHVIPLIVSTVIVWGAGLILQKLEDTFKEKKKAAPREMRKQLKKTYTTYKGIVLAVGIVTSVVILIVCKYPDFANNHINSLIEKINVSLGLSLDTIRIIQPLGISFYTLQAVSYLSDIYRGKYEARKNILRVSLYLSFMLTVVEGPIARYDQFGMQLEEGKSFDSRSFEIGTQRIIWGLFKKIVVADRAAEFVNAVFDNSADYTGVAVVAAILFYTLQLYFEFSGVMDIVCGFGNMLSLNLPENFERPFFSKSINEFWQRWHITLGAFLRDYIFYSISFSKPFMNATKSARKKFNPYYANLIPTSVALFFVWFTNGFWHGSGFKYIVYGLYYYFLMMLGSFIEPLSAKLCEKLKIDRKSNAFGVFQIFRTFIIVNIGMLIFRADSLSRAGSMLVSVFKNPNLSVLIPGHKSGFGLDLFDYAIIIIGAAIVFAVGIIRERKTDISAKIAAFPFWARFIGYLAATVLIVILGAYGEGYGVVDLIYANF